MKKKNNKKKSSLLYRIKKRFLKIKDAVIGDLDEEERTSFSIYEVIGIIVISILFGVVVGYVIMYSRYPANQVGNNKALREVVETYQEIANYYYGGMSETALSEGAIKGMIQSLNDANSNYMDQEVTNTFNETVDGSFVGIGVMIQYKDDYNEVVEVYENGPAEKAGIKVGDVLLKVDGQDIKGVYGDKVASLVRGKSDTMVEIAVMRDEKEKVIKVKRGVVELQSVSSDVINYENRNIGYIKISSFADNTSKQFSGALGKIEESIDSLVIDVRDNPGGHLQQVTDILSVFFSKGKVLYQIESKEKKDKVTSLTKESRNYPVMVLINRGSASASEILASCFKDNYPNAKVIGITSYGKGTVQKSVSLRSGNSFKYTTQKWLTAKGEWIDGKGVVPDIEVTQSNEYLQNPVYENDVQLQEAFKQIKES